MQMIHVSLARVSSERKKNDKMTRIGKQTKFRNFSVDFKARCTSTLIYIFVLAKSVSLNKRSQSGVTSCFLSLG